VFELELSQAGVMTEGRLVQKKNSVSMTSSSLEPESSKRVQNNNFFHPGNKIKFLWVSGEAERFQL